MRKCSLIAFRSLAWIGLAAMLVSDLPAQGIFGTLTGVVTDPTQAVVGKAKVTLKDAQSGSQIETVTNSEGYYTFASVPVGTYGLTVESAGFSVAKIEGITLSGGEKRNVNTVLQVGSTAS